MLVAPRAKKPLPKALTVPQARAVAQDIGDASNDVAQQARDTALFSLLYGSGLRIAEALALNVADAPAEGSEAMLLVTGKGNKQRIVPVLPAVREAMAAWLRVHPRRVPPTRRYSWAHAARRLNAGVAQRTLRNFLGG